MISYLKPRALFYLAVVQTRKKANKRYFSLAERNMRCTHTPGVKTISVTSLVVHCNFVSFLTVFQSYQDIPIISERVTPITPAPIST